MTVLYLSCLIVIMYIMQVFVRVVTTPSPPFSAGFLLFRCQTLVHSGATRDASRTQALFSALCNGLTYAPLSNHVRIFLPDLSLTNYIFHTHKHPLLLPSHLFHAYLLSFLSTDPVHHVDIFRYSIKWSGLPGKTTLVLDDLTEAEQRLIFPLPPTPPFLPKARLLRDLREEYFPIPRTGQVW